MNMRICVLFHKSINSYPIHVCVSKWFNVNLQWIGRHLNVLNPIYTVVVLWDLGAYDNFRSIRFCCCCCCCLWIVGKQLVDGTCLCRFDQIQIIQLMVVPEYNTTIFFLPLWLPTERNRLPSCLSMSIFNTLCKNSHFISAAIECECTIVPNTPQWIQRQIQSTCFYSFECR